MSHHIIHKQKIILKTGFQPLSQTVANEVSDVCKNDLPNLLQTVFDELAADDEIVRIDSLQIDLGILSIDDIKQTFAEKVTEKIKEAIVIKKEKTNEKNEVEIIRKNQSLLEALILFLQTGTLPWFINSNKIESFEMQMLQGFEQRDWQMVMDFIKRNYARQPALIERLAYQFSDDFLYKIINSLPVVELNDWNAIYKNVADSFYSVLNKKESEIRNETWIDSLRFFLQQSQNKNAIEKTNDDKKNQIKTNRIADDKTGETQFVNNCGMVLLHPFFEAYFDELSLLKMGHFKNDKACKRAALLLNYLATGETKLEEWNAVLVKVLCGLPLNETLPNTIDVSDEERAESEAVLQSVIRYWSPLKNTSVEGLQNSFLQREGKLEQKENGWLLTIEQITIDVLLSKLPWGFSTLQLPWMNKMISVDWC